MSVFDVREPLNFLCAADLRLDKPFPARPGRPDKNMTYDAARGVIDCALSRGVSFVFLRGELFDAYYGAKAPLFLIEQTRRLSDAGIACYILNEGTALDARWLAEFPERVSWLSPRSAPEDAGVITCGSHEIPLARLLELKPPSLRSAGPEESECTRRAWLVSWVDAGEPEIEFIELNPASRNTVSQDVPDMGASLIVPDKNLISGDFESAFWDEAVSFKSALDLRIGLFDALKERGLWKHLITPDASSAGGAETAAFLENMTEEDAESVLLEACGMASISLFKSGDRPE